MNFLADFGDIAVIFPAFVGAALMLILCGRHLDVLGWASAALLGGVMGTQLGSKWLPVPVLRYLLAAVLLIAGLKLILT